MILLPTLSALRNSVLTVPPSGGVTIPEMTNAQKLSLPANTAVGTRVKVSDAFKAGGTGDARFDTAYLPTQASFPAVDTGLSGGTHDGKPYFATSDGFAVCFYSAGNGYWGIVDGGAAIGEFDAAPGSESNPWLADWSGAAVTLTHPAVQQLQSPSSSQGGVFVSGGTQDGIYTNTPFIVNGRAVYGQLGVDIGNLGEQIQFSNSLSDDYGIGPISAGWGIISNDGNATFLYYSLSDVATPDLASNWKNASDDSPASITVTSVTQGEIYAGLAITNDGITNGSSYVSQPFHGRQYYMGLSGGGSNNLHWDTDFNVWTDDVGVWTTDNVAFPWQGTDSHSGHNGATFVRNDVAAEANWSNL